MQTDLKLHHVDSDTLLLAYIERRLNFVLSRFGSRLGRVNVRISTASAKSPEDFTCRMSVDLAPFGVLVAEATDPDVYAAIDRCAGRLARRCASKCSRSRSARSRRMSIRLPGAMPLAG